MTTNRALADLLAAEIKDLYTFEKHLTKEVPTMAKRSRDSDLPAAFTGRYQQNVVQVTRLEQAAKLLGITPGGRTCTGVEGCFKEGAEALEHKNEDHLLDFGLIGAGARVEHYKKIAGYTTAITLAQSIGATDVVCLLKNSLADEVAASEELLFIAASLLNNPPTGAKAQAAAV